MGWDGDRAVRETLGWKKALFRVDTYVQGKPFTPLGSLGVVIWGTNLCYRPSHLPWHTSPTKGYENLREDRKNRSKRLN